MARWDYFTGASERWRTDAKVRARRVIGEHGDDPVGYAEKRLKMSPFGSFQRRRWGYIRRLVIDMHAHERGRRIR